MPPVFSPEIISVEITFLCPGCNRSLLADARWGGKPFTCPKCDATGKVPNWTRAKAPPDADTPKVISAPTLSPEEIAFLSEDLAEPVAALSR